MRIPPDAKICVLFNPNAGEKAGVQTSSTSVDDVRALLKRHQIPGEIVITYSEEHAKQVARDAALKRFHAVVGVGGDGTMGPIARELMGSSTALGIIPSGSVMNIGRMIGIPRDLDGAAETIAASHIATIDVGLANGSVFFEAASVGLNAPVFEAAQRFDAGEHRSILRAIWVALRYRPARMAIRLDDRTVTTRALMVTVANCCYTGIGFTVAPMARLDDGLFDVSVFRRFSRTGLLIHFTKIAFGRRAYSPKVVTYRSRAVHITSVHPLPCRADAVDLGFTPATFVCKPAALNVFAPEP